MSLTISPFLFMCMSTPVALFVCIYCYTGSLLEALRRNIFFYTYSTYTLPNLYSDVTPDVTPYFPTGPVGFQTNNIPFKEGMFTSIGKNSPVKSVTLPSQVYSEVQQKNRQIFLKDLLRVPGFVHCVAVARCLGLRRPFCFVFYLLFIIAKPDRDSEMLVEVQYQSSHSL